jgi:putative DNA primase/helicase
MSELPPDEPSIAAAGADSRQAQGRGHRGARRPDVRGDFGAGRDADRQMIAIDPHAVARTLGGNVSGCDVVAPGPGHSRADRSLSIKLDPSAPDGFIVHSFAGDSVGECREHVRAALGLDPRQRRSGRQTSVRRPHRTTVALERDADYRSARALWLWNQSRNPRGTVISSYLASRGLTLPDSIASDVIRFHSTLQFNGTLVPGMVALFRDIRTNAPCGIHRTFLDEAGAKLGRKMLGRARDAAIKIDADEDVTLGLHIGEGIETCLAAWFAGFHPVWALGSATAIAAFPLLTGIEAITVLGEVDDQGANYRAAQTCAARWINAGRDAFIVIPKLGGDLNDVWRQVAS